MNKRIQPEPPRLSERREEPFSSLLAAARVGGETQRPGAHERVWRKVAAQMPNRRRRWVSVLATAAACATVAFTLWFRPSEQPSLSQGAGNAHAYLWASLSEPSATVTLTEGEVHQLGDVPSWAQVKVGSRLAEGTALHTADHSRAWVRFPSADAMLNEGTRATVHHTPLGFSLRLHQGTLLMDVAPFRASGFVVEADTYRVEVSRSVFQVKVAADRAVSVSVYDGTAHIRGPATNRTLHSGQSWVSPAALTFATGSELKPRSSLGSAAAREEANKAVAGVAPAMALGGPERAPEVTFPHGSRVSAKVTSPEVLSLIPADQPLPPEKGKPDIAPLLLQLKRPLPAAERESTQYELARLLARRGQHQEALEIYERLARGAGAWAEPALYEVGRLRLRSLSDPSGAVIAFTDYGRRYPRGVLAPEAALSSIEAHLRLNATAAALREMDGYIEAFAFSERLDDVRFVRAMVRRDKGDCIGALIDYRQLVTHPKHADDALYFTAICEQEVGNDTAARLHLSDYLYRFPEGRHFSESKKKLER